MPKHGIEGAVNLGGPKDTQDKIFESSAGSAYQKIIYPGIRQCITLTGIADTKLIGAHISPGQSPYSLQQQLKFVKELGGDRCTAWYLIGHLMIHIGYVTDESKNWTSTSAIAKSLKDSLETLAPFYVFDTSYIGQIKDSTGSTTIAVEWVNAKPQFSAIYKTYAPMGSNSPNPQHIKIIEDSKMLIY